MSLRKNRLSGINCIKRGFLFFIVIFVLGNFGVIYKKDISLYNLMFEAVYAESEKNIAKPDIKADAAILINAKTGEILYKKNMHKKKYPASTTKILTGLLALENLNLSDIVTIDGETPYTKGARIYLLEGEKITVSQLIHSLLIESANDSAVALALEISGDTKTFAKKMNQRARDLGAINSNFINPNGLENEEHVTTAYDLAMISMEAMKNETFRNVVSTYKYIIPASNKQEIRYLYNTNMLLRDNKILYNEKMISSKYEGVTGIKTGYTSQARSCLVSGAQRDGMEIIGVILDTEKADLYTDTISLLDYGFANYEKVLAMGNIEEIQPIKVLKGKNKNVNAILADEPWVTLPKNSSLNTIVTKLELKKEIEAPVEKGTELGELHIIYDDEPLRIIPVIAEHKVDMMGGLFSQGENNKVLKFFKVLGIILVAIATLLLLANLFLKRKRRILKKKSYRVY